MLIISGSTRLVPLSEIPIGGLFTDHNGKVWMRAWVSESIKLPDEIAGWVPIVSLEQDTCGRISWSNPVPENRVAPVNGATFTIETQGGREVGQ